MFPRFIQPSEMQIANVGSYFQLNKSTGPSDDEKKRKSEEKRISAIQFGWIMNINATEATDDSSPNRKKSIWA